jgi:hypothetical protein
MDPGGGDVFRKIDPGGGDVFSKMTSSPNFVDLDERSPRMVSKIFFEKFGVSNRSARRRSGWVGNLKLE